METCSICESDYEGYGHNAWPYPGRCCGVCNDTLVIPARLKGISAQTIKRLMDEHKHRKEKS